MATKDQQEAIRNERIEGVRTLQSLGAYDRDADPAREEDAQLGAWPAGTIARHSQEVGLSSMSQEQGTAYLERAVSEESISLRMERERGTRIADGLVDAAPGAPDPQAVAEQGEGLKRRSLKSYWDNREELIQTIKDNKVFQLGNNALGALVALDDDGRITQMIGDPRAKLAIMAVKEAHAGINDPSKSKISRALSGDTEAAKVVTEVAADFVPKKFQPAVKPLMKAAQVATAAHEKGKASKSLRPDRDADIDAENGVNAEKSEFEPGVYGEYAKPDRERTRPDGYVKPGRIGLEGAKPGAKSTGPSTIGSGPSATEERSTHISQSTGSLHDQLNTYIARGNQGEQSAAERQRRMTAMLNGEDVTQTAEQEASSERAMS